MSPGPVADRLADPARLSIAELRRRIEAVDDEATIEAYCARLAADPRSGARLLGERMARRLAARRHECARLAALFERRAALFASGAHHVAGIDEVGVGPLAGPVVAAAVVLPERVDLPGLDDSKKLSRPARERLCTAIREQALAIGIGEVPAAEIDRLNILRASLEAMRRAVTQVSRCLSLDHLLVDARTVPGVSVPQTALIHGDAIDGSIAAASIVAKEHRDALMRSLDALHPGYGFARHVGYGTAEHMDALRRLGATPVHRRSFAPVAAVARG
ncbi:MAG: ribonuclease HII [Deltaproteobacteria bacterium]|nr:ribonuclease HII [Deltaproteobacteria bacterium]MBW2382611.1 ribonuclease HII [Deltaproteobacteria bacterium]MBW2697006.1 ribonuclease HII [Deltaproteobacteria bacterium]